MPKAVPTLYNHHEHPATSHILNVETMASGCWVKTSMTSSVLVTEPTVASSLHEWYIMDSNNNNFSTHDIPPNPGVIDDDDPSHHSEVIGIKFKPPKAKWYGNSVCCCTNIDVYQSECFSLYRMYCYNVAWLSGWVSWQMYGIGGKR